MSAAPRTHFADGARRGGPGAIATGAMVGAARADGRTRDELARWVLPLVGGAVVGGLAAGRFETAAACLGVAVFGGAVLGAGWPSRSFVATASLGAGLAVLLNVYLNPGTALPWGHVAGRAPTLEGARYGALLALRMLAALAGGWVLTGALPVEAAVGGIARLLRPLRAVGVPVDSVRASLGLALRMVPLVRGEAARIARVQALRAGAAPRGVRQRVEQVRAVAVPLVVCSLERAERTALALEARHYRGLAPADAAFRPAWAGLAAGTALAAWGLLWRA